MMSRERSRLAGFTLLEVVMALTLLATMLALLFSGLRMVSRGWDVGSSRAETADRLVLATRFLREELGSAFPWRLKATELRLAFEGDSQSVSFVSARPRGMSGGGPVFVSLKFEAGAGPGDGRLVMRRSPALWSDTDLTRVDRADPYVLIDGLESARFAFFGATGDVQRPEWADRWREPGRLPSHVRLEARSLKTSIPDVVIDLRLGEEAGCPEVAAQRACPPRR